MDVGERRADPEDGLRTAIKTALPGYRAWFVFHAEFGGYYTTGEREGVAEWPTLTVQ